TADTARTATSPSALRMATCTADVSARLEQQQFQFAGTDQRIVGIQAVYAFLGDQLVPDKHRRWNPFALEDVDAQRDDFLSIAFRKVCHGPDKARPRLAQFAARFPHAFWPKTAHASALPASSNARSAPRALGSLIAPIRNCRSRLWRRCLRTASKLPPN